MDHEKTMEHICSSLCAITEALDYAVSEGIDKFNTMEGGQATDMIKDLSEACYYLTVSEAMKHSDAEDRYGYMPQKMGHGKERSYVKRWMDDPEGFEKEMRSDPYMRSEDHLNKRDRYGETYHEYLDARKHYTESKSQSDKDEMEMHANEHLMDMMTSVREIYKSADPEMRKQVKTSLTKFVSDLPA